MEKTAIKYHCGCGKAYTSYPAYSMHKKHKHNNIAVPGTRLPNHYCPKRGRPSSPLAHRRPLPRRSHPLALPLHALTALETSLLRLQEAYPPLLSDPEEETDIAESCRQLRELEKEASSQAGVKLVQAVAKFLQAVGTHLSETLASGVAQYLQLLTPYLLENLPAQEVRLNWEDASFEDTQVDALLFNRFFHSHAHTQALQNLSRRLAKPPAFLLQITVMLSHWLLRLGHCNAAINIKNLPA